MWPHVYTGVTEDMDCFHDEIFGPAVTVKVAISTMPYTWQCVPLWAVKLRYTLMTGWRPTDSNQAKGRYDRHKQLHHWSRGPSAVRWCQGSETAHANLGSAIESYSYWHAVNDELSGSFNLPRWT